MTMETFIQASSIRALRNCWHLETDSRFTMVAHFMQGKPLDLITVAATAVDTVIDITTSSSFGIGIATSSSADTAGGCTCRLVVVASSTTACKLEVTKAIKTIDWAVGE